ncbi:MAG: aspartate-semialdehyde dehydrogenase [Calditrichia bacterium]
MQKEFVVAVVGATGLVGQKMIEVLQEKNFPVKRLLPLASERSRGEKVRFREEAISVEVLDKDAFSGVDLALFSAGGKISKEFAPLAARAGAVVIDNSSAWRMDPDVPLVVPEVNPEDAFKHNGIIANPNCSTIQMVVALQPLHRAFKLKRVVVSTYQAVSGSGKEALTQLEAEIAGKKPYQMVYPYPIAYNCLPHIDFFHENGFSNEEMKMILETRKIMNLPQLKITATTVRVPVKTGHSESVNAEFENPFTLEEVRKILSEAPGVVVQDRPQENIYPLPLDCADRDEVFVGRIRRDESVENGLHLWVVSDNLRKGAATNAVQIAELLVNN